MPIKIDQDAWAAFAAAVWQVSHNVLERLGDSDITAAEAVALKQGRARLALDVQLVPEFCTRLMLDSAPEDPAIAPRELARVGWEEARAAARASMN
jgi:hypothetical protein